LSTSEYEDLRKKFDALSASIAEILKKLQAVETTLSERTKNLETQIAGNSGDVSDLQDLYRDCRERCVKDQARIEHRVDDLLRPVNEKIEKLFRYVYIALGMIMLLQFVLR
jgi:chromosome segregation ATPase